MDESQSLLLPGTLRPIHLHITPTITSPAPRSNVLTSCRAKAACLAEVRRRRVHAFTFPVTHHAPAAPTCPQKPWRRRESDESGSTHHASRLAAPEHQSEGGFTPLSPQNCTIPAPFLHRFSIMHFITPCPTATCKSRSEKRCNSWLTLPRNILCRKHHCLAVPPPLPQSLGYWLSAIGYFGPKCRQDSCSAPARRRRLALNSLHSFCERHYASAIEPLNVRCA